MFEHTFDVFYSGETFISFNKQMKGSKREIIQLGVPLFQPTKDEAASNFLIL